MALQSSGAISLDDIHDEAGGTSGSTATINDADIRDLIDKSAGATMAFNEWYGASAVTPRGLFFGGSAFTSPNQNTGTRRVDIIDYITIASTGNATDFGNLSADRRVVARGCCGSATRNIISGGKPDNADYSELNIIEYVEFSTTGNATDFGDLINSHNANDAPGSCSSATRGIILGGYGGNDVEDFAYTDQIQYITIANTGNATDFGDAIQAVNQLPGAASTTRGVFFGGNGPKTNIIQYITIASTGNATDFGDLSAASRNGCAAGSATRAIYSNFDIGNNNTAEYVTIASTGNTTNFGNMVTQAQNRTAVSNKLRFVAGGGSGFTLNADYLTIANTGNATDFGDLTWARAELGGGSSEHGGIA